MPASLSSLLASLPMSLKGLGFAFQFQLLLLLVRLVLYLLLLLLRLKWLYNCSHCLLQRCMYRLLLLCK